MRNKFKVKNLSIIILIMILGVITSEAQNLTASQMNIYFGKPQKITLTSSQGTAITEFDTSGRILHINQGNMSVSYDWAPDGSKVILSMYQGQNIQYSSTINISEMTSEKYIYNINGAINMTVNFNSNGAMSKVIASSPQMTATITYFYNNLQDMYPHLIEQTMGDQSIKLSVTINKTDSFGNAIEYTQECMGHKEVSHVTIEYY